MQEITFNSAHKDHKPFLLFLSCHWDLIQSTLGCTKTNQHPDFFSHSLVLKPSMCCVDSKQPLNPFILLVTILAILQHHREINVLFHISLFCSILCKCKQCLSEIFLNAWHTDILLIAWPLLVTLHLLRRINRYKLGTNLLM